MRRRKPKVRTISRRALAALLLMLALPAVGAMPFTGDTLPETSTPKTPKKRNIITWTVDFIENFLQQDTMYVSPNRFNLTAMPQYTYSYEYYRFATSDRSQSISVSPVSNNKLGMYFGWRWIFLGYSFSLSDSQPKFDMELNLYCSRLGLELFYRKRDDGFRIRNLKGFNDNGIPLTDYSREFNGLSVSQGGANLFYIFNYKKFSFPAAFSQSTNQRISAGSFILGLSYNEQLFNFDYTKVDPRIESLMQTELKFDKADYKDFSINLGYSYNWVFAKDFLANISLSPAIGYKNTSLKLDISNSKEFISSINFDLISRLALVYNNGRYYAGASLVSHTYSYRKTSLSILNGFGHLKVYMGINFWRRK